MTHCGKNYIKEYDTVIMACQYLDDDGAPISLDGIDISAHMESVSKQRIDVLIVEKLDIENGLFTLKPSLEKLPIGTHSIDVLFEKDGSRLSSDTFQIVVRRSITAPN